jgi:transcription factor IIIB subunit 2
MCVNLVDTHASLTLWDRILCTYLSRVRALPLRMWQVGRRPSGICGAALLVAARMHGFHLTQKDVVAVVRVCDSTLRKRLEEFEDTPSSSLTMQEFMKIDIESEADPPAYTQSRKRARLEAQKEQDAASLAIVDDRATAEMEKEMNDPLFAALDTDSARSPVVQAGGPAATASAADTVASAAVVPVTVTADGSLSEAATAAATSTALLAAAAAAVSEAGAIGPMDDETLSDLDDGDIDQFILDKDESAVKASIWKEENKAYIATMKSRAAQAELDRENGVVKADPKKKKKKKVRDQKGTYSNPTEAMQQLLAQKQYKVSPKINYAVLKMLGIAPPANVEGGEGAAATPTPANALNPDDAAAAAPPQPATTADVE